MTHWWRYTGYTGCGATGVGMRGVGSRAIDACGVATRCVGGAFQVSVAASYTPPMSLLECVSSCSL